MSRLQINRIIFEEKECNIAPNDRPGDINGLKVKITLNNIPFMLFDTFIYFSYDKKDYIATVESEIMSRGFSAPFVHFNITRITSDVIQERYAEEYLNREEFDDLNEDLKDFVNKNRFEWAKQSQETLLAEEE